MSLPDQKGPAAARNAGVSQTSGEYLLFIDDDILLPPDALEELAGILSGGELDALSCAVVPHESVPQNCYLAFAYDNVAYTKVKAGKGGSSDYREFCTSCAIVKREWFDRLGGFDERLTVPDRSGGGVRMAPGYEDSEFAFRLQERGGGVCSFARMLRFSTITA